MQRPPPALALSARARERLDLSAPQLLVVSFAALIAVGTLGLLALPGLWTGEGIGFVDALFMATSAVCVSGLSVRDALTDAMQVPPDPDAVLKDSDSLVVAGADSALERLCGRRG